MERFTTDQPHQKGKAQFKELPLKRPGQHMRGYFSFMLDITNAINIPKEIISINTSTISIGNTSLHGTCPVRVKRVPYPSCEADLLIVTS